MQEHDDPPFAFTKPAIPHVWQTRVIGNGDPGQPRWMRDLVARYAPPLFEHKCLRCGKVFHDRENFLASDPACMGNCVR